MSNLKEKIRVMLVSGYTYKEIGQEVGVTSQRIGQLRKKWFPKMTRSEFGASKRKRDALASKTRIYQKHYDNDVSKAKSEFFSRKKQNAKSGKWEFSITREDVIWNDVCPIFGIKIDWFATKRTDNSPSFDRINPKLGYIPGNVAIISWRANRIKNDGTAEEHRQIAEFMMSQPC